MTSPPVRVKVPPPALMVALVEAVMFHDDDAVPDIDLKSEAQIRKEAKELKKRLDGEGIAAEMVAPRLWFAPQTVDGAYTSNDPKHRQYAIERSLRSIDIANILGTDLLVLWLAREGTYIREAKNGRRSLDLLVQAFDKMLAHDRRIRLSIEPKPNEPMDHAYIPTIGHALAVAQLTRDPKRVGVAVGGGGATTVGGAAPVASIPPASTVTIPRKVAGNVRGSSGLTGRSDELTPTPGTETKLLKLLAAHAGTVVSRKIVVEHLFGSTATLTVRTLDNVVLRLRKLFEIDPAASPPRSNPAAWPTPPPA